MRSILLRVALVLVLGSTLGCSEVRGRRLIQKANQAYRDGQYKDAVALFEQAERFVPNFGLLWLNKGYTCREMLIPGAKTPENAAAARCALTAFKRFSALRPEDKRGAALYVQTLFDADEYETLAKMYEARVQKNAADEEALNGLIQVYSKWPEHTEQALAWYEKKAQVKSNDAEAQYAVGVFIWQQLFSKGGGADKSAFDPRADPDDKKKQKTPPGNVPGDITGKERIELADRGLRFLEKAVELRPKYQEAMTYLNLLYRQKSFAYFDNPDEWQKCIDKAIEWQKRGLALSPVKTEAPEANAAPAPAKAE
ncbi:MAG: hypothetical protein ACOY0T_36710 [Myxococcota bacterium]